MTTKLLRGVPAAALGVTLAATELRIRTRMRKDKRISITVLEDGSEKQRQHGLETHEEIFRQDEQAKAANEPAPKGEGG